MSSDQLISLRRDEYVNVDLYKDANRIVEIFKESGYKVTLEDAVWAWERVSKCMCSEWISLPEEDYIIFDEAFAYFKA
jgi:hypothetical protein